jgi:hypothetical protein
VRNDNLVAPDGISIEDRLKSLVKRTAEDIKSCSNVCDTYAKKRLLAKVFQSSAWDVKLLSWVTLFSKRREDFEFELSLHINQGVDKANAKLNVISDVVKAIDEKFEYPRFLPGYVANLCHRLTSVLKAVFEQLISPEQKQVMATVLEHGGVMALRNNDKTLLEIAKTSSKAPPSADGHQALSSWEKPNDAKANADDLRADIFEEPDAAVEKNKTMYLRKFEEQKLQITELKSVIERQGDRLIEEMNRGPHQRIRDRVCVSTPH